MNNDNKTNPAPVDVLAVIGRAAGLLDCTVPPRAPDAAADLLAAGAAVAKLVEALHGALETAENEGWTDAEWYAKGRFAIARVKGGGA